MPGLFQNNTRSQTAMKSKALKDGRFRSKVTQQNETKTQINPNNRVKNISVFFHYNILNNTSCLLYLLYLSDPQSVFLSDYISMFKCYEGRLRFPMNIISITFNTVDNLSLSSSHTRSVSPDKSDNLKSRNA